MDLNTLFNITSLLDLGSRAANAIVAALVVMVASHIFLPDVANIFTQIYKKSSLGAVTDKEFQLTVWKGSITEIILRAIGVYLWVAGLFTLIRIC